MTGEPQRTFWQHRFSMLAPKAEIHVEGQIEEGFAADLERALAPYPNQDVLLLVNSPGGVAVEGAAAAAVLQRHGRVTVYARGIVASAATLLLCAASRALLHPLCPVMIHDPSTWAAGTAQDLRKTADSLDTIASTYAAFYAKRAGVSEKIARGWMTTETWLTAEEAVALRLADAVQDSPDATEPAPANYSKFQRAPAALVQLALKNGWATVSPDEKGKTP